MKEEVRLLLEKHLSIAQERFVISIQKYGRGYLAKKELARRKKMRKAALIILVI